jgi:hypothetical protein
MIGETAQMLLHRIGHQPVVCVQKHHVRSGTSRKIPHSEQWRRPILLAQEADGFVASGDLGRIIW